MTRAFLPTLLLASLAPASVVPGLASAYFVESRSNDTMGDPVPVAYDTTTAVEFRIATAGMPGGDGSEDAAIEAAFQTWADVECATISFERGPDEATPMARHWQTTSDRYIVVYWSDDAALFDAPRVGFFDWAEDTMGVLIGGQVILNSRHHMWSTTGEADKMDVQGTVTALVGRVLGITSNMEGNSTYPRYSNGDTSKRMLGADDIAALQFIYGDGTCTPEPPEQICLGTVGEMCPPMPKTMPGDAGVIPRDGGPVGMPDAGPPPPADAGVPPTGGDDEGCSCVAAGGGPSSGGAVASLLVLCALALRRRRRR